MAARGGESKRGLIVTLVFFILLSIGLGVTTYMGYSEQDKLKQEADKAKQEMDKANKDRDWALFQAGLGRYFLGSPPPADSRMGREFRDKKLSFVQGTYEPREQYAAVKGYYDSVLALCDGWDDKNNRPRKTIKELLADKDKSIQSLTTALAAANTAKEKAQNAESTTNKTLEAERTQYKQNLEDAKAQYEKDRGTYLSQISGLEKKLKNVRAEKDQDPLYLQLVKDKTNLETERAELQKKITAMEDKLVKVENQLTQLTQKVAVERPADPQPRGKIIAANGERVTIDLGSSDGLTAQTTFAVFGTTRSGRIKDRSKASIEVVKVGRSQSEAVVTGLYDPKDEGDVYGRRKNILEGELRYRTAGDPIVPGDVLINPSWNPNAKTHIAIAGIINLDRTGVLDMESLVRLLERRNIIVDAYLDTRTQTVKGRGINRNTDLLVVGGTIMGGELGVPRDKETVKKLNGMVEEMRKKARENLVNQVSLRHFLQQSGFNFPRTTVNP